MNQKPMALVACILILMSTVGFAYSHWSDAIRINGTVKMAHIRLQIISYKNLTSKYVEKYSNITSELSPDGHTLTLTIDGVWPCWFVWIGLVTQNKGTLPANVKPLVYSYEDADGFSDYFNTTEYFYGPYAEEIGFGDLEVWGKVKVDDQLKSDGTVDFPTEVPTPPPFIADPGEKVVIWIWIHCEAEIPSSTMGKIIKLYIKILDELAI